MPRVERRLPVLFQIAAGKDQRALEGLAQLLLDEWGQADTGCLR